MPSSPSNPARRTVWTPALAAALLLVALLPAAPAAAAVAGMAPAAARLALGSTAVIDPTQVVSLPDPGVVLQAPSDGRLRADGVALVITGAALTDRAGPPSQAVAAGRDEHLVVFGLRQVPQPDAKTAPPPALVLVVAGVRRLVDLTSISGANPGYFAAAVASGITSADLELSTGGFSQDFDLMTLSRTGISPAVLYRDANLAEPTTPLNTSVHVGATVPVDPGETYTDNITVPSVTLSYFDPTPADSPAPSASEAFLEVSPTNMPVLDASGEHLVKFDQPIPDQFVHLALSDGITLAASQVGGPYNFPHIEDYVVAATYYFVVPATITSATLRVDAYQGPGTEFITLSGTDTTISLDGFSIPLTLNPPAAAPALPTPTTILRLTHSTLAAGPAAAAGATTTSPGHHSSQAPLWVVALLLAGAAAVTWRFLARRRRPSPAGTPAALVPPSFPRWGPAPGPAHVPPPPPSAYAPAKSASPAPPVAPSAPAPSIYVDAPVAHPPFVRPPAERPADPPPTGPRLPMPAYRANLDGDPPADPSPSWRRPSRAPHRADLDDDRPRHDDADVARPAPSAQAAARPTALTPARPTLTNPVPPVPAVPPVATGVRAPTPDGPGAPAVPSPAPPAADGDPAPASVPAILVEVLGPCRISGPGTGRLRPRDVEVLIFLALADRPVTNDDIRAAIAGPSDTESNANTVRTWLSRIRGALGPGVLPEADYGRYQIGGVDTDAGRFTRLLAHASSVGDSAAAAATLKEALELVRGRPFDGTDYRWSQLQAANLETAVVDAADRLAGLAFRLLDPVTAGWAAERGLSALTQPDDRLLAHLLMAGAAQGPGPLAQAWRQVNARCAAAGDAPNAGLLALYDRLRSQPDAAATANPRTGR